MADIFLLETLRGCHRSLHYTLLISLTVLKWVHRLGTKRGAVKKKMRICFNINVA